MAKASPMPGNIAGRLTQTRTSIRSFCAPGSIVVTGSASVSLFTQVVLSVGTDQVAVLIRSSWTAMLLVQSGKMMVREQISVLSSWLVTFS